MITGLRMRVRERDGALAIQVAFALLTLMTLSTFVVDYGMQLVSHNEAQNLTDAAALAGATALAYDDFNDRTATGRAYTAANSVASTNHVARDAAAIAIDPNFLCAKGPDEDLGAVRARACVEVTAYRDAAHNNAIGSFFARLMGTNFNTFGVSARAIGRARAANSTKCLRPIAIPDRWGELTPPWTAASTFNWRDAMGNLLMPAQQDTYTPPDALEAGSGLQLADRGLQVTLTEGVLTTPQATIKPWQYLPIEIPNSQFGAGAAALRSNTNDCAAGQVRLGDAINIVPGDLHSNALSIIDGLTDLIAADPNAVWNAATRRVDNSCADVLVGRCASMSPRIIAIALYDPETLADDSAPGLPASVTVNNIVGLFVESVNGTNITGYLTTHPGLHDADTFTLFDDSAFLRAPMLVE